MEKTVSAGILVKVNGKFVIGHVTGQNHYDIFKGRAEPGEELWETAIRECREESGLDFSSGYPMRVLGLHNYTKKKDLALYVVSVEDIDTTQLKCQIIYENKIPEMDYYELVTFDEMLDKVAKNMREYLEKLSWPILTVFTEAEWDDMVLTFGATKPDILKLRGNLPGNK